jgi:hypothetical protein
MNRKTVWRSVLGVALLVAVASPVSADLMIEPPAVACAMLEVADNGKDLVLTGGRLKASSVGNGPGTTLTIDGGILAAETVNATEVLQNGGVLAPGNSAGKTTIFGNYTLAAPATLQIEISGTSGAGLFTGNDWLDVRGTATLAGTLSVVMLAPLSPGDVNHSFTILSYFTRNGTFAGLADGQRFSVPTDYGSPYAFDIHYRSGSNDNITLTLASVPEPSTILSLLCGLAAFAAFGGWRWWARRTVRNATTVARGGLRISPTMPLRFSPIPERPRRATIPSYWLAAARQPHEH